MRYTRKRAPEIVPLYPVSVYLTTSIMEHINIKQLPQCLHTSRANVASMNINKPREYSELLLLPFDQWLIHRITVA
jgi:hypothetical protein